jgi:hypothetical protein
LSPLYDLNPTLADPRIADTQSTIGYRRGSVNATVVPGSFPLIMGLSTLRCPMWYSCLGLRILGRKAKGIDFTMSQGGIEDKWI